MEKYYFKVVKISNYKGKKELNGIVIPHVAMWKRATSEEVPVEVRLYTFDGDVYYNLDSPTYLKRANIEILEITDTAVKSEVDILIYTLKKQFEINKQLVLEKIKLENKIRANSSSILQTQKLLENVIVAQGYLKNKDFLTYFDFESIDGYEYSFNQEGNDITGITLCKKHNLEEKLNEYDYDFIVRDDLDGQLFIDDEMLNDFSSNDFKKISETVFKEFKHTVIRSSKVKSSFYGVINDDVDSRIHNDYMAYIKSASICHSIEMTFDKPIPRKSENIAYLKELKDILYDYLFNNEAK